MNLPFYELSNDEFHDSFGDFSEYEKKRLWRLAIVHSMAEENRDSIYHIEVGGFEDPYTALSEGERILKDKKKYTSWEEFNGSFEYPQIDITELIFFKKKTNE
jgi:hypothetical protein